MGIKLNFDNFVKQLRAKSFLGKGPVDTPRPRATAQPASELMQSREPVQSIQPRPQVTKTTKTVEKKPSVVKTAKAVEKPSYDFPPTSSDPRDEKFTREQIKKGVEAIPVIGKTARDIRKRESTSFKTNVDNLTKHIIEPIFGAKNQKTIIDKAKQLIKDKKFQEAKDYIDSQLKKAAQQGNVYAKQKIKEGGARYRPKR